MLASVVSMQGACNSHIIPDTCCCVPPCCQTCSDTSFAANQSHQTCNLDWRHSMTQESLRARHVPSSATTPMLHISTRKNPAESIRMRVMYKQKTDAFSIVCSSLFFRASSELSKVSLPCCMYFRLSIHNFKLIELVMQLVPMLMGQGCTCFSGVPI